MRITPVVLHAAARLPALTSVLSDTLAIASMTVEMGGWVTITTVRPHGYPVNQRDAFAIVDADTPNPVTAATVDGDGRVHITTLYDHDLTTNPDTGSSLNAWNEAARLGGFASSFLNGLVQLVSVYNRKTFTVLPAGAVGSITLTGAEVLLERLEQGIIGWHAVTATGSLTYRFETPADVGRSYTVQAPKIVRNIRVGGAVTIEAAGTNYVRGYSKGNTGQIEVEAAKTWMFICPRVSAVLSRDRKATSDAMSEQTPGSDNRQILLDGFTVYAFIPAEDSNAGIVSSDLANGELFAAVLRTFHGLSLPRSELYQGDTFTCVLVEHGQYAYDAATYIHAYTFEAPAFLTNNDAIQTFEWSRIDETKMTVASGLGPGGLGGTVIDSPSLAPVGSVAFRDIVFGPAAEGGIQHDDAPGPLTAIISLS